MAVGRTPRASSTPCTIGATCGTTPSPGSLCAHSPARAAAAAAAWAMRPRRTARGGMWSNTQLSQAETWPGYVLLRVRRGRLGLGHAPGDGLLELGELDDLHLALGGLGLLGDPGGARPARAGAGAAVGAVRARTAGGESLSTSALTIRPPGPEPEALQIEPPIPRDPLGDRRGLDPAVAAAAGGGGAAVDGAGEAG